MQGASSPDAGRRGAPLRDWVQDARARTLALVEDLTDEQLLGPRLAIVNPLLWEIGHVAWFQEKWALRGRPPPTPRGESTGAAPLLAGADALYDSSAVAHDLRWDLPLPSRAGTIQYLGEVRDRVVARVDGLEESGAERYFVTLGVMHEDMHDEAILYTRQTLGYPAPRFCEQAGPMPEAGPLPGDVEIPGGTFALGSTHDEPFVFDNEKWSHPVEVHAFRIARAAVTQQELAVFVDDGGYRRPELWTAAGWRWRALEQAEHPVHWRKGPDGWQRRAFDRWVPLEPHRAAIHVSWFEADAYCRWAGRRLPTELEWEVAAAGERDGEGLSLRKRRFPWGDEEPTAARANLDARLPGTIDVGALPEGDSAFGCRQMLGNVWEWTDSDFLPYPGFVADPYREYSEPWFGDHKVLRGGAWTTRGRLLRNTWRNFYQPHRRDVLAGLRTCAR